MTNEAQTNIVVAQAKKMLPMMKSTLGESVEGYAEFFKKSLLNMAEWKDQQFKEYLEKKKDSLEMDYHTDSYEGNAYKHSMLLEIINELFPESEQDNKPHMEVVVYQNEDEIYGFYVTYTNGFALKCREYEMTDTRTPFVHELQDALRLCGLDELADNIQI